MINEKTIEKVIDKLSFVKLKSEIKEENSVKHFVIETQTKDGLSPLEWKVAISPSYPFKIDDKEPINFFNTSLITYPHIMRSGFVCLHTPKVEDAETQFLIDLSRLKEWIDKYYIRKEKDNHYEELVVERKLIDDIYYNFFYTDTSIEFPHGDYGTVDLVMLVPGCHDGKRMDTFLANTFNSKVHNAQYSCQWEQGMQRQIKFEGIYCFLDKAPSVYDKFIIELYTDMSSLFSWSQMEFLKMWSQKKNEAKRVPLFCGYKIPNGETRWQVAMLKANDFPIKSEKTRCGGRSIIYNTFKKTLIDWATTYNCSYNYFFGRGSLPSKVAEKKILIIGIGAIGSMVATTLVRCGAKYLDYYDIDLKEPGNICRSDYDFLSGISDKTYELSSILHSISPFVQCDIPSKALDSGIKLSIDNEEIKKTVQEVLSRYDIIFDCSTDDGLMYALDKLNLKAKVINLSISNHANEIVCAIGSNIARTIKLLFSQIIESDTTDMFYPTGCWSPTFKASYNDIATKLQFAMKHIIGMLSASEHESSFYISETQDGMTINRL